MEQQKQEAHQKPHHKKHDEERVPEGKMITFWIAGALSIYFGAWIAGHLEKGLGVSDFAYYGTGFLAFLLVLFGGLAWIGVAVGVAQK